MNPVAVTTRVDQKRGDGAVGFLFGRHGGQLDHQMRFLNDLPQHA